MIRQVKIDTEYITLGQFLKVTDCIDSGGQAKSFLQDAVIYVDGERENRRGRKLYKEMTIRVEGIGVFQVK